MPANKNNHRNRIASSIKRTIALKAIVREDIENRLAQWKDDLSFIQDALKETIETTLDELQKQAIGYSLEGLSNKIGELSEQNQELRSPVSNISSFRIG